MLLILEKKTWSNASINTKLSSGFSIIAENAPANSGNTSLKNCTDFNVNRNIK